MGGGTAGVVVANEESRAETPLFAAACVDGHAAASQNCLRRHSVLRVVESRRYAFQPEELMEGRGGGVPTFCRGCIELTRC